MDESGREAFRSYVAGRSTALLRTAYLLTGNRSDAEDLLQTALAKTYLSWDRIRDREAVDGYVRRVMVNTQTSFWRRRRPETPYDEVPDVGAPDRTADHDLHDALWTALATLPARQRAALVLRYYEDLSEAETARVLGVSVGTVKSTTSRALLKLRDSSGLRDDPHRPSLRSTRMSPLDDQLHTALHSRAAGISAPADPLAGIERRATRIRRRRTVAVMAGGAALVTAVALTVPALLPGEPRATLTPATQAPTVAPEPSGFQATPENLLADWPQRGTTDRAPSDVAVRKAFAQAMNRAAEADRVTYRSLFIGDTGKGEAFTVGQAWFLGDAQAYDVSYTTRPNDGPVFFLGGATPTDPAVLAFAVPNLAGMSDLLVVVPQPRTGQVLYAPSATAAFQPITGQDRYDGVVLIDRSTSATDDQLELLDGNGNLDAPTYKGPVAPLVCGFKECA